MLRYNLAKLVKRPRGSRPVVLPVVEGTLGAEREYLRELRSILRALARAVSKDILPIARMELQQKRQTERMETRLTQDVDLSYFVSLFNLASALGNVGAERATGIFRLEGQRNTKSFILSARKALGVDLSAVVREEDLEDYLTQVGTRNASLIQGLAQATIQRVQQTVLNAVLKGVPATELQSTLAGDFQFADARARLIARDQIAKLTSEMSQMRHRQAGITEYIWRTSRDERVRPRHQKLEGVHYTYGQSTGAEQGLPPGQPIQCRCVAQPVVTFGEGANKITL